MGGEFWATVVLGVWAAACGLGAMYYGVRLARFWRNTPVIESMESVEALRKLLEGIYWLSLLPSLWILAAAVLRFVVPGRQFENVVVCLCLVWPFPYLFCAWAYRRVSNIPVADREFVQQLENRYGICLGTPKWRRWNMSVQAGRILFRGLGVRSRVSEYIEALERGSRSAGRGDNSGDWVSNEDEENNGAGDGGGRT